MKQIKRLSILALGLLFVSTSCSVEKRVHTAGYHIDWNHDNARLHQKNVLIRDKDKGLNTFSMTNEVIGFKVKPSSFRTHPLNLPSIEGRSVNKNFSLSQNQALPTSVEAEKKEQVFADSQENVPSEGYEGFGIAGFILSILGIFTWPLAVLGVIFSAISLYRIRQNPRLKGKGLAIAGLIIGIVVTAIVLGLILIIGAALL